MAQRAKPALSDEEFIALYPTTSNARMAELCGMSVGWVEGQASALGVRKTKEHRAAQTRRTNAAITPAQRAKTWETRRRTGTDYSGERHPRWRGGQTQMGRSFNKGPYKEWRLAVLTRDAFTCQQCGTVKHHNLLQAHHIQPWAKHPDLRYSVENGTTLCEDCHRALHGTSKRPRDPLPCACGCGTMMDPVNAWGKSRRFLHGHATRGRLLTPEQRAKNGAAKRGTRLTPEHRAKIGAGLRGHTTSPQTRAKIAASLTGRSRPDMKGKPVSAEHRAKISAAKKGRPTGKGSKVVR